MGGAARGSVLEPWLVMPDVVVDPGEKLVQTIAKEKRVENREKVRQCNRITKKFKSKRWQWSK